MRPWRLPAISYTTLLLLACSGSGDDVTTTTDAPSTAGTADGTAAATTGTNATDAAASTSTTGDTTTNSPTTANTTTESTTVGPTTDDPDSSTGAPVACPPGFFCDDFESHPEGAPPGAPWQPDIGSGSAQVESGKAVSGARAVHLKTGSSYGGRALLGLTVPEVLPSTHLFGRMRMWLTQASPDGVHWTMIEASGQSQAPGVWNDQPFAATLRYGGQNQQRFLANFETPGYYDQTGPGSDCWQLSQQKIPEQVWTCMEWEFDADNRQMRFWLDGQEIADLAVGSTGQGCINHDTMDQWYYPTMDRVSVGWVDYQDGGARDLWIDDVTIGPARVGCD